MPLDLDPSRGPVLLLTDLEYAKRHGGLDEIDEKRYSDLIEVLHKMSDADQGRITEGLFTLAFVMNSPGAAKALRGLRLAHRRREVVDSLEMYPVDPDGKAQASNNLPLILSGTSDVAEIKLLAKCSRFKRPDGSRTPEDIVFCTNAIEALSAIHSAIAQEALLVALASETDVISNAARQSLVSNSSDQTRTLCRELLALPKREAIKRLAQMEGKGGFAALTASLLNASRYDRFFDAAHTLASR